MADADICDVLMILSCHKYEFKQKYQNETWIPKLKSIPNFRHFHIIGDSARCASADFVFDDEKSRIYVNTEDTYEALPRKTFLSIKAISARFSGLRFILKTDDDMDCNIEKFEKLISLLDGAMSTKDYIGEIIHAPAHVSKYHYPKVPVEKRTPVSLPDNYYAPGRFYVLSKTMIDLILSEREFFWESMYEDFAVGVIATKNKVKFASINAKDIFKENMYSTSD